MSADAFLRELARVLHKHQFEAILIGNAAGALQGAPVTTLDFDFFFRKTPVNLRKLRSVAKAVGAVILRPYYPVSDRVVRDEDSLQIDFMGKIHGVRWFASLRSRASRLDLGGNPLLVADLADVIRSKRAARRPRDLAVLGILERTLDEKGHTQKKARRPEEGK